MGYPTLTLTQTRDDRSRVNKTIVTKLTDRVRAEGEVGGIGLTVRLCSFTGLQWSGRREGGEIPTSCMKERRSRPGRTGQAPTGN